MSGSTIGGIVGGIIGFYFGNPQLGWMIGSAIGGAVDPDVVKGPRLKDAQTQTSQEGIPRPIVYGKAQVAGNVIQIGPLIERKHREGGKGGGPVQETYTYTRSYAIRVCEGPIAGIARIWRDGKLVYDARDPNTAEDDVDGSAWSGAIQRMSADTASFGDKITIYLGNETQLPDPVLEGLPAAYGGGVGNVPAYRGTAYVVIENDDLTDRQGTIPQYQFEVISAGTVGSNCTDIYEDAVAYWPLDDASRAGTAREVIGNHTGTYSDTAGVQSGPPLRAGSTGSFQMTAAEDYMVADWNGGASVVDVPNWTVACYYSQTDGTVGGSVQRVLAAYWQDAQFGYADWILSLDPTNKPHSGWSQGNLDGHSLNGTVAAPGTFMMLTYADNGDETADARLYLDGTLVKQETVASGQGPGRVGRYMTVGGAFYPTSYGFVGCVSDVAVWHRTFTPDQVDAAYLSLQTYRPLPDRAGMYVRDDGTTFGACNDAVALGDVDLADVVTDLCARVGITAAQLDVTALVGTTVRGAVIGQQMSASDALKLFQRGYNFDLPEWGDYTDTATKLRAVVRGGASVVTITDDDLVESDDDQETRQQAVEFPRKVNVVSPDPTKNYEPTKQTAERRTDNVKAVGEVTIELPLTQTETERARSSDIYLKIAWAEAEGRIEFQLPEDFSRLTPSDVFTKDSKRWRIEKSEYDNGVVKVEGVRDRASAYTSSATASSGTLPFPPVSVRGPTVFTAMNLPSLRSADNSPGMYVAARGFLASWPGCDITLSVDGGLTFKTVARILPGDAATLGTLTADCTSGASTLSVSTPGGTLESVTAAQIAAGFNAAAIVSDDVAEIVQFQTVAETGTDAYDLSTVTRGQLTTTAAAHSADDTFVVLDETTVFVRIDIRYAGQTLIWRPVTLGTLPDNNDTYETLFAPQFTGPAAVDFLETKAGDVIRTLSGEYIQVTTA